MNKVLRRILLVLIIFMFSTGTGKTDYSTETSVKYSIITGWKTEGSHELLEKKATVLKQLKTPCGLAISFGSLLGHTKIVEYDNGLEFLRSSYEAGVDYIVPAAGEFMFGVDTFKILAELSDVPAFISANIVDENTRKTIIKPYALWNVSGLKICIIGISDMNIIKDSPDKNVEGLDVISYNEALKAVFSDVKRENPDIIIAAGRMERDSIIYMAVKYPSIDAFITNNQSGGFADKTGTTTTVNLAGKPVYIASEQGNHLGKLTVRDIDGIESWEFTDIVIGDEITPDEKIAARFKKILDEIKKKEYEESVIVKTGKEVASILKEIFDVDAALIGRQSLYYYPLEDSLTLYDLPKVIKPSTKLILYSIKGKLLESAWERSKRAYDPQLRLHIAGMTVDGKVDSIPIQDDRDYTVLTTEFLRQGGNGYEEFVYGTGETLTDIDMLKVVESYLIAKDERLREAEKKKIWALNLQLNIGSNFNRLDVDTDKEAYGERVPKPFRDYNDQFTGNFSISSWNNNLTVTKGRSQFLSRLDIKYIRSGYKPEKGSTVYKEADDNIIFYNKYTYNHPSFLLKPYIDTAFNSELYSGGGKHPISVATSAGVTRNFPGFLNLIINVGFGADRNFFTNVNAMGITSRVTFDRSFSENNIFTTKTRFNSVTDISYKPIARYNMEFFLKNHNDFSVQLWKKFNLTFHINTYVYRDTTLRKVAVGFTYDATIGYGMDWSF